MLRQGNLNIAWKLATAAIIYMAFAIYLYQPYLKNFERFQYLYLFNIYIASIGSFILSRRWIAGFSGSFFAGALYGFGPFLLGLVKFHPTVGLLVAAIPWLFCPAAFSLKDKRKPLSVLLAVLPFIAIVLFFQISSYYRLFAASTQAKLHLNELYSLLAPLIAAKRRTTLIGFYHIPIAALIMGLSMFIAARRYTILSILVIGTILSFCDSLNSSLEISPVIWLSIGSLCCSIFIGIGFQGLTSTSFTDRKWILTNAIVLGLLAIVTLLLATKYFQVYFSLGDDFAKLFTETAKMYILGSAILVFFFLFTYAKLRLHLLREILMFSILALDIFFGARFIIDTYF
jgi:hypothetical protein